MRFLSRLFGTTPAPTPDPVMHKGFSITPTPMAEGGQFRLSARIEKDGKVHHLIRADTLGSADAAADAAIAKARQVIDEQGDRLL